MMFLERTSNSGILESEYYVFNGNAIDMPNCTRYAHDRAKEECWDVNLEAARPSGGFGNAKHWYSTTSLPKGSEMRVGAIAVFDGEYGHVAVVERIIDSTHAIVSQSNYNANKKLRNWYFWERRQYELKIGKSVGGTGGLLGFIYCPINDIRTVRDKTKDQVEVIAELVNVRKDHSTSADKYIGRSCPLGLYNVKEWYKDDNYTWAKLDDDCWIACGDWTNIYKKEETVEEPKEDKIAKVKEMLEECLKIL